MLKNKLPIKVNSELLNYYFRRLYHKTRTNTDKKLFLFRFFIKIYKFVLFKVESYYVTFPLPEYIFYVFR